MSGRLRQWRGVATAAVAAFAALTPGCGSDAPPGATASRVGATVLAAASLGDVLPRIAPDAAFTFAGSDTLATQIREGVAADVVAAANERIPAALHAEGLIERPVPFATNRLVLVVGAGNPKRIRTVADLRRPGVIFVMADAGVPVGDYTRTVLDILGDRGLAGRAASQEDDVRAVIGKVALGEADAGFAYATDVIAVAPDVEAVEIPAGAQPPIRYAIAVVSDGPNQGAAREFVAAVTSARGREQLRGAGFGVP